jgi:hypothetical protein
MRSAIRSLRQRLVWSWETDWTRIGAYVLSRTKETRSLI